MHFNYVSVHKKIVVLGFIFALLSAAPAWAAAKSALVLAAFGSAVPDAVKSIEGFAEALRQERADLKVVTAFTSREIVEKLAGTENATPSLPAAISALADEGYAEIGVLPLLVVPGKAYAEARRSVEQLQSALGSRVKIRLAEPLLGSEQDVFSLASYLVHSLPSEIKPGEAVIFAGRGSEGPGGLAYTALNWALFLQGEKGSLHLVVNLENRESIQQAMQILKLNKRKVVWLIPLMAVQGERAAKDVFSTDDASLASRLKDAGHTVRPYKQGLVSNPAVQGMWKGKLARLLPPPAKN